MARNLICILFALVIFFQNMSCRKPTEQLPPETQEGKYIIGFKVNGKVYEASGKATMGLVSFGHVGYTIEPIDSSILIRATSTTGDDKFEILFRIKYINGLGTYPLKVSPYYGKFYFGGNGTNPLDIYTTSSTSVGTVIIKYFNGQFRPYNPGTVLAGTFEMTAINQNGKSINITDGRFDIGGY